METLRITEEDLARDLHAVLAKVRDGAEIVVEEGDHPVAIIRAPVAKGRLLSQCIAIAEARGPGATLDDEFMRDVEEGIASRSVPWNPPSWE